MYGGRTNLGKLKDDPALTNVYKGFDESPSDMQLFPTKVGQRSFYPVLVADIVRSYQNVLAPSNHVVGSDPTGYMPTGKGGANVGFIDGHVEWRATERPWTDSGDEQRPAADVPGIEPVLLLTM